MIKKDLTFLDFVWPDMSGSPRIPLDVANLQSIPTRTPQQVWTREAGDCLTFVVCCVTPKVNPLIGSLLYILGYPRQCTNDSL